MPLLAVGISHHDVAAPTLAALAANVPAVTARLEQSPSIDGYVVLATCNRFEVYVDSTEFHGGVEAAIAALTPAARTEDGHRHDRPDILDCIHVYADQGAVAHLFEVACGLDSMVVGEAEIVGQVRTALAGADRSATTSLRRMFQDALSTARTVATRTDLGRHGRSLASVGLDLVEDRHGPLTGGRVLLLGTGAYAGVVVATLTRRGCTDLVVHSASGRGAAFAARHPVRLIGDAELIEALVLADAVVAVSGAAERTLTRELVYTARRARGRLLPILDLSTRGDVPSSVADLPDIDRISLDEIGAHAPQEQAGAVLAARDVVARAVEAFEHVSRGRTAAPAVTAFRAHVMRFIEAETEQARRRYDPATAEAVAQSLRRVSGALLHTPSIRAAELARTGDLDDYRRAMHTLFGIEVG